ncbi:MAG: hypothetical protein ACR2RD_06435 [Woeseiaceae bacterium]
MKRALKVIFWVEIVLGVLWTILAAMAQGAGGLAVFGLFLLVYGVYAAFFLFAAWVYWTYVDCRRSAGWIMVLPILFWFAPLVIRSLAGGVLTNQQFVVLLIVLMIIAIGVCWVAPRRAATIVPGFLLRSRLFNWLILLSMIGGWAFFVFVLWYVANGDSSSTSTSGTAVAYAIVLAAIYLIWLGFGSFGASTWAWVSLRGGVETTTRKLNVAQLVFATPGVLIGISVAVWLAGQGHL